MARDNWPDGWTHSRDGISDPSLSVAFEPAAYQRRPIRQSGRTLRVRVTASGKRRVTSKPTKGRHVKV